MEQTITPPLEWIHTICDQFTEITGWTLRFMSAKPGEQKSQEAELSEVEKYCWYESIEDGNRCLGYLYLTLPEEADQDRLFVTTTKFAELIAGLISKIETLNTSLELKNKEVSTLMDVGLSSSKQSGLQDALQKLLEAALQLTGLRSAGFFLLNSESNQLSLRVQYNLTPFEIPFHQRILSESPPDLEAFSKEGIVISSQETPQLTHWLPEGCLTGVCVSVQSDSGPFGTLWAFDRRSRRLNDRDIHVLKSIGAQVGTILERAVLIKESQNQLRLKKELKVISESFPAELVRDPSQNREFQAAVHTISHHEVGGDLCEFITLSPHVTCFALGDASGDSIPAAVVMASVRGALRTLTEGPLEEAKDTRFVISRINNALYHTSLPHQFMSMLYGVIDTQNRTFTYTNAGHPAPFWAHKGKITSLTSHGMLLGVTDTNDYDYSVIPICTNDIIVGFSDGISEAMSSERKMFRSDGIMKVLENHTADTAEEVMQGIWSKLQKHLEGGNDGDDRTLMVIKFARDLE
ncbi:GAF domain-containing SpoIIE family protein phosphatase [Gimesia aquarii]|uniref:Phosphoserine phosphatase RsbU n=1 Tax=Gimesia aquarii TaxID=2527964 RepID=A0A517WWK7_9PLAN|nr:GAF domain-containing SpoIIE family protein phosphatase [Gimesia aquarii]QDU09592.1 Phosphoserine phosphatase RsbU [Gimesia aquarii]